MKAKAEAIAKELMRALNAKEIPKIGVDEIRTAIRQAGHDDDEQFEMAVIRAVVESV